MSKDLLALLSIISAAIVWEYFFLKKVVWSGCRILKDQLNDYLQTKWKNALFAVSFTRVNERKQSVLELNHSFEDMYFRFWTNSLFVAPLRGFSNTETLCSEYKYYCEECRSKQEAHKRLVCMWILNELLVRCGVQKWHLTVMSVTQDACKETANDTGFAPEAL